MTQKSDNKHINRFLDIFDNQYFVADLFGVKKAAVSKWKKKGYVPPMVALKMVDMSKKMATMGILKKKDLCPQLFKDFDDDDGE